MMFSKSTHAKTSLAAAAVAALMLVGCDRPAPTPGSASLGDKMEQGANKMAQSADDAKITAKIKTELAMDPSLSALSIDVDTKAGMVSLSGKAPDSAARERATRVASAVQGVVGVDNKLVVSS
jgi:osmotically-inducible protein OsmY